MGNKEVGSAINISGWLFSTYLEFTLRKKNK